jgi:hypothetical protein
MTCVGEGAHGGDCCGPSPLVWVKLAPPPIWLEPTAVVDMLLTIGVAELQGCYQRLGALNLRQWWKGFEWVGDFGWRSMVSLCLGEDVGLLF